MINMKKLNYALLIGGIAIATAHSQNKDSEYVAPPDAGPKGKAPRMKVQLLNPGEPTKQYAVIFYQGDEAFPDCWSLRRSITLPAPILLPLER